MKANPDNRWRKMPPGSADSLPPSNAKPYTPSHNLSNGVTCGKLIQPSSLQPDQTMSDQIPQSKNAAKEHLGSAPKPFKKRYLASNQGGTQGAGSSSGSPVDATTPPSPSPVPGVSPDAAQVEQSKLTLIGYLLTLIGLVSDWLVIGQLVTDPVLSLIFGNYHF